MTLSELSYSLLEILREGSIVDDERFDKRLLDSFCITKRSEYLNTLLNKGINISENCKQYLTFALEDYTYNGSTIKRTVTTIPTFLNTRYGLQVYDIYGSNESSYIYSYVTPNHFKFSGNGKFNSKIIFVTYKDSHLLLNSTSTTLPSTVNISGILEDPTSASGYDIDNDIFPIDYDGVEYIKKMVLKEDVNSFLSGIADEVSDSSGEIVK
jgi:hypothetical protein